MLVHASEGDPEAPLRAQLLGLSLEKYLPTTLDTSKLSQANEWSSFPFANSDVLISQIVQVRDPLYNATANDPTSHYSNKLLL